MFERIIVVIKKTALEELLLRHHSLGQVRFFLERRGASFDEFESAHNMFCASLKKVFASLPRDIPHELLPREYVATFLFRPTDLVIVVGPDGLCINVAKYLDGQSIMAVNPDPKRIDGVLTRFRPEDVELVIKKMLKGIVRTDSVMLAEATTNDGQTIYAVNDFLIGRRDMISARYSISCKGKTERQSSSGILVSTGIGSTGWLTSVISGFKAMAGTLGYNQASLSQVKVPFAWDASHLVFAVREPFPSKYTGSSVVFGQIEKGETLVITSEMGEGGTIFSDGVTEDAIEFNAGTIATIGVAGKVVKLVSPALLK